LSHGKVLGVIFVLLLVLFGSSIFVLNSVLPLFPGSLESYQVGASTLAINSNTVPIANISEDWAGVSLHKVSLIVNQQFENDVPSWYNRFVGDSCLRILSKLGIEIVDKQPCDATLTINVTGGADWSDYNPSGKAEDGGVIRAPTAAHATVWVSVVGENKENLEFVKRYRTSALSEIVGDFPLSLTPIDEAIAGALIPCLTKIWCESVCIKAMSDSDELISWAGAYAVYSNCSIGSELTFYLHSGGWDAVSPDVISALVNAYEHGSKKTSQCAYDALDTMTAGYNYDPLPSLLPALSPEILDALTTANSTGLNLDSQGNIASITPEAIPGFIRLLSSRNMLIRVAAAQALSNLGPEAIPALSKAANDNVNGWNTHTPIAAIYGLKCIGTEAIPALIEATNNPGVYYYEINWDTSRILNAPVQEVAVAALKSTGLTAIPSLIYALENDGPKIIAPVADVLGSIGPAAKEAVPALIQALDDAEYKVANNNVRDALWKITGTKPNSLSDQDIAIYQEWWTTWIKAQPVLNSYLGIYAYNMSYDFTMISIVDIFGARIPIDDEVGFKGVIPGGPSDGKLFGGDIIKAFNGTIVENYDYFTRYFEEKAVPNDLLVITVFRNYSEVDVSVTLGTKPLTTSPP
jgi:hypothetical protein